MGADYYQCKNCDIGFRDDSNFCVWCDCGSCFCTAECGKLQNWGEWDNELDSCIKDPQIIDPSTCIICRNEKYTDYTLLQALMSHFHITKEQVINIWRVESKKIK